MTDSEIDVIATGILLLANEEKWYEQKVRIAGAIRNALLAGRDEGVEFAVACTGYTYLRGLPLPRDFGPGLRQVNEEG